MTDTRGDKSLKSLEVQSPQQGHAAQWPGHPPSAPVGDDQAPGGEKSASIGPLVNRTHTAPEKLLDRKNSGTGNFRESELVERIARALCRARKNGPPESYPVGAVDQYVDRWWHLFVDDARIAVAVVRELDWAEWRRFIMTDGW